MSESRFDTVLIDLSGVLYVGDTPIAGAVDALARLRASGRRLCFLTNTTRRTRAALVQKLNTLGLAIAAGEIMTAASAAHAYVLEDGLRPQLLIHPDLAPEFEDLDTHDPNAVVVGDAGAGFTYDALNAAFRVLMAADEPRLVAMGGNRYFADGDQLSLDMGPFVAALEVAADVRAVTTGKPAAAFFHAALRQLGGTAGSAVMIGDDLENDIGGAQRAGLSGVLVRTGKYRADDERHPEVKPEHIADDFAAAVDWILAGG